MASTSCRLKKVMREHGEGGRLGEGGKLRKKTGKGVQRRGRNFLSRPSKVRLERRHSVSARAPSSASIRCSSNDVVSSSSTSTTDPKAVAKCLRNWGRVPSAYRSAMLSWTESAARHSCSRNAMGAFFLDCRYIRTVRPVTALADFQA